MEHDDELNDLRLQFQVLQKQQEKRKLDRKKEKEPDKLNVSAAQDDLDLSQQGIQADNPEDRWELKAEVGNITYINRYEQSGSYLVSNLYHVSSVHFNCVPIDCLAYRMRIY